MDANFLASLSSSDCAAFFRPTKLPPKLSISLKLPLARADAARASSFSTHAAISQPQFCSGRW
jgi:hypothetical protein